MLTKLSYLETAITFLILTFGGMGNFFNVSCSPDLQKASSLCQVHQKIRYVLKYI